MADSNTPNVTEREQDEGVRLMLAYQAGDEAAFDRLVETYSPPLYSLLTRFLGPSPRREDLVQEVFLRLIRARERYQPTARLSTWLYRIAFNLAANERQRTDRRSESHLDETAAGPEWVDERADAPSAGLEQDDVVRAVRAAIAALPDNQRMALILAKYDGLSYAEVAEVLETSEKAVKSTIHRAREKLRESLASFLQEERA